MLTLGELYNVDPEIVIISKKNVKITAKAFLFFFIFNTNIELNIH
jgi:hypothetical protein